MAKIEELIRRDIDAAKSKMAESKDRLHWSVKAVKGNAKTGKTVFTASLMPVVDCTCTVCAGDCYDLKHDVVNNGCRRLRAINHVAHGENRRRFWDTVFMSWLVQSATMDESGLRINVGGDVTVEDLRDIAEMCERAYSDGCGHKREVMLFTKNYDGLYWFLKDFCSAMPGNLHIMVSRWPGLPSPAAEMAKFEGRGYHYMEALVKWGKRVPKCLRGLKEEAIRQIVSENDAAAEKLFRCPGNCGICLSTMTGCFDNSGNSKGVYFDEH